MNDAQRRRWFQLHLSTVIALTLTAGGFLYLNVIPGIESGIDNNHETVRQDFGWPFPTFGKFSEFYTKSGFQPLMFQVVGTRYRFSEGTPIEGHNLYDSWSDVPKIDWLLHEFANVVVCLTTLATLGVAMEWFARRRKGGAA
jgi:hypothetical protein